MAISASGYYGLTLEEQLADTAGFDLGSETLIKVLMVTDGYTPNFSTHEFRNSITNEVTNANNYTTGGEIITTTALAIDTPAAGQLNYDSANPVWNTSTITNAMAGVGYRTTATTTTDELIWLSDFVTAASTNNGTFTISVHGDGWWYFDFTP